MPFTVGEVENIANSTLDYFVDKGRAESQHIQDKPLLKAMQSAQTTFPGGKEFISGAVKGNTTSSIQGFQHDDDVGYSNPANAKRYNYPWKLIHLGIEFSMHEVAKDGISIVDTTNGKGETEHSERELTALVNILNEKFEDMAEGWDRGFNNMYWGDGSADPSWSQASDRSSSTIRLRVSWSAASISRPTPGGATALCSASTPRRPATWSSRTPCRRNTASFVVMAAIRKSGWPAPTSSKRSRRSCARRARSRSTAGIPRARPIAAWPTSRSRATDRVRPDPGRSRPVQAALRHGHPLHQAQGHRRRDKKKHYPARPENKYMFFRAMTWMGGLICNKRNAHGVYSHRVRSSTNMSFKTAKVTLASAVATNGTITVGYPTGTNKGTYTGAFRTRRSPKACRPSLSAPTDFTVSFGASNITVTYKGTTSIPANTKVMFQFDFVGK
jgi:hypothetical protein